MRRRRGSALRRRYGHSKKARKKASLAGARHTIHNVNPGSYDQNFIFWFGSHGATYVRAWGSSLQDALDEAVDWLSDHYPGLLADTEVEEEYKRLIGEGVSEEEAQEQAEMDMTPAGGYGQHIRSDEWGIEAENPTHARVLQIQGRSR